MMAEGTTLAKAYVQILPSMDGFQNDLERKMGGSGEAAGKKSGMSFGGAFTAAAGAAAKAGIAAVTAAGAGVVALTKSAVSAYGEYEQLAGGVNKLFGDASDQLMSYAEDAYKTAGLSANEYMEQATSFSAALINSLGGNAQKAAEMTDVAMRAMSDNVNTFGTDMAAVQNAFQGFSKQNYTMLDNLKLGYGGTKTEMERLIADANEYAASIGQASDLSIDSFADIVQAIELIQEKQNIAGTTAKEAASTLQGSFEMTKSAWTNLVAGLANPDADLSKLVTNFTESAKSALGNLLPIVKTGLQGVGKMITELLPEVFQMIPDLLDDLLPGLLDTIDVIITDVFPVLVDVLVRNLPKLITTIAKAGKTIVKSLFTAIDKELSGNAIYDTLKSGIEKLLPIFSEVGGSLIESGKELFGKIGETISKIDFDKIFDSIANAAETLAPVLEDAGDALVWLWENAIGPLIEWAANDIIPTAIDALSAAFKILKKVGDDLKPIIKAVWDNFLKPLAEWTADAVVIALGAATDALSGIADEFEDFDFEGWINDFDNFAENWKLGAESIGDTLSDNSDAIDEFFNTSEFGEGWNEFWQGVGSTVADVVGWIAEDFTKGEENLETFGEKTFDVVDEFKENWKTGEQSLEDFGAKVFDIVSDFGDNWKTGEKSMEDFGAKAFDVIDDFKTDWKNGAATLKTNITNVGTWFTGLGDKIADLASKAWEWGRDLVKSFIDGIKNKFDELEGTMERFGELVYDYIHFSEPEKGALSNFETYAPDMVQTFARGIHNNAHYVEDEMKDLSAVIDNGLRTPDYNTPYRPTQSAPEAAQAQSSTITLRLVDNANRLIAEGTAGIIDIINGNTVALSERGLASV
jgi:phage-related protein